MNICNVWFVLMLQEIRKTKARNDNAALVVVLSADYLCYYSTGCVHVIGH